jgi:TM2 domain-containing membrane protein YozV
MNGQVLDFSIQKNLGLISGSDGKRYVFAGGEWRGNEPPKRGMEVDFDSKGEQAIGVYLALDATVKSTSGGGEKNRITAGILALTIGGLGVHKFYLGYTVTGLIYIVAMFFSMGLVNIFFAIIAIIEGITYLTLSDEEFEKKYVIGKKTWF